MKKLAIILMVLIVVGCEQEKKYTVELRFKMVGLGDGIESSLIEVNCKNDTIAYSIAGATYYRMKEAFEKDKVGNQMLNYVEYIVKNEKGSRIDYYLSEELLDSLDNQAFLKSQK